MRWEGEKGRDKEGEEGGREREKRQRGRGDREGEEGGRGGIKT